jgi:hypothetical protein
VRRIYLAALLSLLTVAAQDQVRWMPAVAADGSFSLQQPDGWTAKFGRGTAFLSNPPRDEQIMILRKPRDPAQTAAAYAETVVRGFQQSLGAFRMSNLTTAQDSAAFLVTYSSAGKNYSGPGAVVLKGNAAWWVSYGSPAAGDLARGASLVAVVAGSVTDGAAPAPLQAPAASGPPGNPLVGNWSTVGYYGDLVNPSNGAFLQSSYTGEWYAFNADGSYRYTISGSGQFITGVVMTRGSYELNGNKVVLHQKTESWYPMPRDATHKPMYKDRPTAQDSTIEVEFHGPAEMKVRTSGSSMTETFKRDPNSR